MRWIFISLVVMNLLLLALNVGKSPEPASASVAEQEPLAGETLVLLSESARPAHPGVVPSAPEDPVDVPDENLAGADNPAGTVLCTLVGPFRGLLQAEYFQEHLVSLEIIAQVKGIEIPGENGYWVYQAPQPSREAALRRLQELQARGIDSFIIPEGELQNGISFGVFNQEADAHQRLGLVVEEGFEASIKKVNRSTEEIWVSLSAPEAGKISETMWLELLAREEGLEMRQIFCPDVASR